jgi:hypothetical protein
MLSDFTLRRFGIAWLLGAIATVVVLAVLTGLMLTSHGWWGYWKLDRSGRRVDGVVVRVEPQNHGHAEYAFMVEGLSHRGNTDGFYGRVGQSVGITYLPTDPNLSCLGAASDRLKNELATFLAGAVLFPPLIILALRLRKRDR